MSDTARMLDETVDRMLRKHLPDGVGDRGSPQMRDAIRQAAIDAGLPLVLLAEDRGGLGAMLIDACAIAWRWGYHAAPFPIVETMLAGFLASLAGWDTLSDATVSDSAGLRLEGLKGGRKLGMGTAAAPATSPSCAVIVTAIDDDSREALCALDGAGARAFRALSGEPWLEIAADKARLSAHFSLAPGTADAIRTRGALLTASAMTGAMARMIEIVIEHANTRVQFGRPLGKFQAVQNLIADAAAEQVVCQAVVAAAVEACDAGRPDALLTRSAKAQAGRAATIVSAAAHQVLGAIGFTEEHVLGHYSRRLWDWRDHWGRQSGCEEEIGRAACADPRGLWSHLVDPPPPSGSIAR